MDIQKEREAFEAWFFCEWADKDSFNKPEYESAWYAWREAKVNAIPEGCCIVPKHPTEEMIFQGYMSDWGTSKLGAQQVYKAMIETAQEQEVV